MELIIENVRSFIKPPPIPIRPLTLLVGENSAGKSTLLSLLSTFGNPFAFPFAPNFNTPPYDLGNYNNIATNRNGNGGYSPFFRLGYRQDWIDGTGQAECIAEYVNSGGAPQLSGIQASTPDFRADIEFDYSQPQSLVTYSLDRNGRKFGPYKEHLTRDGRSDWAMRRYTDLTGFLERSLRSPHKLNETEGEVFIAQDLDTLLHLASTQQMISLAPMRTKPERAYNLIQREFTPEGDHIPFVLPSLLNNPEQRRLLENFGRESGLYRSLEVRASDNEQDYSARVMVTGSGPAANLIDTGYGVSQALPVVVESIRAWSGTRLLLQQPEVHLHPRAQAALGTLFVELIRAENKRFVVETHSDYIIDRVRIEVAKGNIAPEDVCILYFEKPEDATTVYPITLDAMGNILNAPPNYRAFFLQEEWNLLTRAGR